MGGGDLNLKKSWHPGTLRNQEKVWKKEQEAEEERRKMDQLLKEKQEERQMMELQALQEASGKVKKTAERLDWMYAAPGAGNNSLVDEEREAFLLGKKRVDKMIEQGKTVQELDTRQTYNTVSVYGATANTTRDIQAKIRDDPLLAIKKREHASLQAALNNPVELRKLREAKDGKKDKKKDKHKHKERKDKKKKTVQDASDDSDYDRRRKQSSNHQRRDRSIESYSTSDKRTRTTRSTSRRRYSSRSPSARYRSPLRPSPVSRRRSPSRSLSPKYRRRSPPRSPSPRHRRRSPSPTYRRRSPLPAHGTSESYHRFSGSRRRPSSTPQTEHIPSRQLPSMNSDKQSGSSGSVQNSLDEDRARRLAEMQKDAEEWDAQRSKRVEEDRRLQAEEDARDMEAKMKRLVDEDGEGFRRDLQRKVFSGNGSAADAVQRNKAYAQKGGSFLTR